MDREIRTTADGSPTLFRPDLNEHYHSTHGALRESLHVFIQEGLLAHLNPTLSVTEVGFGTGLNALLALQAAQQHKRQIHYTGFEPHPLGSELAAELNLPAQIGMPELQEAYTALHSAPHNSPLVLNPSFKATLRWESLPTQGLPLADVIFFDAFAPEKEPHLWTSAVFHTLYTSLNPGGILVTYSAKGAVRRTLLEVGFVVEKRPGPPGKREMLRAQKTNHGQTDPH